MLDYVRYMLERLSRCEVWRSSCPYRGLLRGYLDLALALALPPVRLASSSRPTAVTSLHAGMLCATTVEKRERVE